jgi:hypothetical protein
MTLISSKKKLNESHEGSSDGVSGSNAGALNISIGDSASPTSKQPAKFIVTTINAQYKPGMVDGMNSAARFRNPTAVCEVPPAALRSAVLAGVLVSDTGNNALRLVELIGNPQASAPAGIWRVSLFGSGAEWMRPRGVCATHDGFAVCDAGHHRIRHVTFDGGVVTLIAGRGKKGHVDGPAEAARFNCPSGVCVSPVDGALIVADTGNHAIRRIFRGHVTTIAGGASRPAAAADAGAAAAEEADGLVDGLAAAARFRRPAAVLFDREGCLLVVDTGNHCVRVVSPDCTEVDPRPAHPPTHQPTHAPTPDTRTSRSASTLFDIAVDDAALWRSLAGFFTHSEDTASLLSTPSLPSPLSALALHPSLACPSSTGHEPPARASHPARAGLLAGGASGGAGRRAR